MFYNSATLTKSPTVPQKGKAAAGLSPGRKRKGSMEEMSKKLSRFDQLEQDTHQIKIDLAILTERAETFATKSDFQLLAEQAKTFATKSDLQVLTERAETFATKSDLQVLFERTETFSTKSDLRELAIRTESFATQQSLMELSARVDTLATRKELSEVKNDLNLLRVEVYKAITVQTKWLTACMFTVAVLSLTAAKLLFI